MAAAPMAEISLVRWRVHWRSREGRGQSLVANGGVLIDAASSHTMSYTDAASLHTMSHADATCKDTVLYTDAVCEDCINMSSYVRVYYDLL